MLEKSNRSICKRPLWIEKTRKTAVIAALSQYAQIFGSMKDEVCSYRTSNRFRNHWDRAIFLKNES